VIPRLFAAFFALAAVLMAGLVGIGLALSMPLPLIILALASTGQALWLVRAAVREAARR
jgi:hypothetical protein